MQVETNRFLTDLDRVAQMRRSVAQHLDTMAATLSKAEAQGQEGSGQLGLEREIEDLSIAAQTLKQGVFRLLVLGDMKRGKSTFLNALIGEKRAFTE